MTILLVQIFVLLLGAFLLGATTACLFRRAFSGDSAEAIAAASAASAARPQPTAQAGDAARFERALAGDPSASVPTPFHSVKAPMVEVQPLPPPAQFARAAEPVQPAAPPPPAPRAVEVAPLQPPAPVELPAPAAAIEPEPELVAEPEPVFVPAPQPEPESQPEPEETAAELPSAPESATFELQHEPSYTEIAVAASPPPAPEPEGGEPSYTQIALAAAAAAAAAEAAAAAAAEKAPADDLTRIRAIDYFVQQRLKHLGVRTFEDIAGWTASDIARVSQTLGFYGRIEQENWIEQAKILVNGGSVEAAPERAPEEVAATVAVPLAADRLHRIIGIDPATEELLVANGVTGVADIAAWTWEDVEKAEALIGKPGRVGLENWIEQARFLTRGGAPLAEPREHAPIAFVPEPEPLAPAPEPEPLSEPVAPEPEAEADTAPEALAIEPDAFSEPEPEVAQTEEAPAAASELKPAPDPDPEAVVLEEADAPEARGDNLAGLRSVRSEALRGDAAYYTPGDIDDLKRIRGIGVLIEKKLNSLGITSYEQVANWTSADIARISQMLDFVGRIERENWVEQARILASGGQTEFSRRADRGEV